MFDFHIWCLSFIHCDSVYALGDESGENKSNNKNTKKINIKQYVNVFGLYSILYFGKLFNSNQKNERCDA